MRWIVLIVGWVVAFLIIKYRRQVRDFIGDVGFAERIFGIGGTNTLVVILGFLVWLFSLMYALGTFQSFVGDFLGPLF